MGDGGKDVGGGEVGGWRDVRCGRWRDVGGGGM